MHFQTPKSPYHVPPPPVVPMQRKFRDDKRMDFHVFRHGHYPKLVPQFKVGDPGRIARITDKPCVFLWPGRGGVKSNWFKKISKGLATHKYVFLDRPRKDFILVHELKTYYYYISLTSLYPDQIWKWMPTLKYWDRIR